MLASLVETRFVEASDSFGASLNRLPKFTVGKMQIIRPSRNSQSMFFTSRSHHEKIVVVDHHVAFLGGLDLCFGRYDTPEHSIGDQPATIWPGKDYYNPRWGYLPGLLYRPSF
jgi:hypothetical protein